MFYGIHSSHLPFISLLKDLLTELEGKPGAVVMNCDRQQLLQTPSKNGKSRRLHHVFRPMYQINEAVVRIKTHYWDEKEYEEHGLPVTHLLSQIT
jgi:hypothetical protein